MGSTATQTILAAGGVVLRPSDDGFEVLVVHRPRYDDWSLPKGKDEEGESPEQAAVREVLEETGQKTRIIKPLGVSSYKTPAGDKVVRWFAMKAIGPTAFVPNSEVDRIAWLGPEAAAEALSYQRDQELLRSLTLDLLAQGELFLVRHAAAGDRSTWEGDDRDRPVTAKGKAQSMAIAAMLRHRAIERIVSSPYLRCVQTVEPLAADLGLEVEIEPAFAEAEGGKKAQTLLKEFAGTNTVVCSHGDVIPQLLDWMVNKGMILRTPFDCKKGSTWEVRVSGSGFEEARYLPPPAV